MAAEWIDAEGFAERRLTGMILDLHNRKRERFSGDRTIHEFSRRILIERQDVIAAYTEGMTTLIERVIAQGAASGELEVDDVGQATGSVRDAVTIFLHPQFVGQASNGGTVTQERLRAVIATIHRPTAAARVSPSGRRTGLSSS